MAYEKLASAIYNDTMAGLTAYSSTMKLSMEQLVDDIVDERLQVMKEYALKGILPKEDLLYSLNCIPVDCKNIENCVFAYAQSDEITFILMDDKTINTEAWFNYRTDKLCSITASMATMAFNKYFFEKAQ